MRQRVPRACPPSRSGLPAAFFWVGSGSALWRPAPSAQPGAFGLGGDQADVCRTVLRGTGSGSDSKENSCCLIQLVLRGTVSDSDSDSGSGDWCRVPEVGSWKLEVGSWKLDVGRWTLDANSVHAPKRKNREMLKRRSASGTGPTANMPAAGSARAFRGLPLPFPGLIPKPRPSLHACVHIHCPAH